MKNTSTGSSGGRPVVMGRHGVVSAGHYLASEAAMTMLRRGGNAMDAAAAAGFALHVTLPHQNGLAGEVPMLVHSAADGEVHAISGHGVAPAAATIESFRAMGIKVIPGDGLLPAIVPPAVGSWILLLRRFGTMRLAEVLAPAIELAAEGMPMYDALHQCISAHVERFTREWPSSVACYLTDGRPAAVGTLWRQADMASTLQRLADADARHGDRDAGLQAAHDEFYRGAIAETIAEFCRSTSVPDASGQAHAGLLTAEDLAGFEPRVEPPVKTTYRGREVCKCGPWTQGPAMLQTLNLLEGFDLAAMGHNSADYVHTVIECVKLAYADREFYYGDPLMVDVPMDRLLSKDYADRRRRLVDPAAASMELRPGDMPAIKAECVTDVEKAIAAAGPGSGDTTSLQVADAAGNVVSAVPSGGWLTASPVVGGLGFPLGTRGQMFSLTPGHPNCLAPGKRPRTSLTPTLARGPGRSWLAFNSPGGDCQDQWGLQFLLNVVEFGMSLQQAVEAPTFHTAHFPSSFYPRTAVPGSLRVEARVPQAVQDELARRGHGVTVTGPWSGGNVMAASIDRDSGVLSAAASPRYNPAYAAGW